MPAWCKPRHRDASFVSCYTPAIRQRACRPRIACPAAEAVSPPAASSNQSAFRSALRVLAAQQSLLCYSQCVGWKCRPACPPPARASGMPIPCWPHLAAPQRAAHCASADTLALVRSTLHDHARSPTPLAAALAAWEPHAGRSTLATLPVSPVCSPRPSRAIPHPVRCGPGAGRWAEGRPPAVSLSG